MKVVKKNMVKVVENLLEIELKSFLLFAFPIIISLTSFFPRTF
jgi:hypothetical protein